MRYKAEFGPAELLCPKYHTWVQFEKAKPLLDATPQGMVVLSNEEEKKKSDDDTDLGDVKLFVDMSTAAVNDDNDNDDSDDEEEEGMTGKTSVAAESGGGRQGQRRKSIARRHGRIFTFRQLQNLGALTSAGVEELTQRLTKWMNVVGPAWRQLAWHL
jgi:hypothetical protein